MPRIWPILILFALTACADEEEQVIPLLPSEAGVMALTDAGQSSDRGAAPAQHVSGTFSVYGLDGTPKAGLTVTVGDVENDTDSRGRVRLPISRQQPFTLTLRLTDGPPHWAQGLAAEGPFSHTVLVLNDESLSTIFTALPMPPRDGTGVLVVEAPVDAAVYADGEPALVWGPEGLKSGDVVPSEGPRVVLFPGLPAGPVEVLVQDIDGARCSPLPAGRGTLAVRVGAGVVSHVAFRCP